MEDRFRGYVQVHRLDLITEALKHGIDFFTAEFTKLLN
jgi:hypothetical protein